MLVRKGFVPPGTDSAEPPVGCGEVLVLREKGLVPVPAVVAERPRTPPCDGDCGTEPGAAAVAESVVGDVWVVRAKGLVDFGWEGGGDVAKVGAPALLISIDCRKGFVPVWLGICKAVGGGGCC